MGNMSIVVSTQAGLYAGSLVQNSLLRLLQWFFAEFRTVLSRYLHAVHITLLYVGVSLHTVRTEADCRRKSRVPVPIPTQGWLRPRAFLSSQISQGP